MSKNIKIEKIATRFAEALFMLTENKADLVLAELESIAEIFTQDSANSINLLLETPSIKSNQKKDILNAIFAGRIQTEVLNLLLLLIDRRRIKLAKYLAVYYKEIKLAKQNIEVAQIISVKPLEQAQIQQIKSDLEAIFKKQGYATEGLELETSIDPSLIAGIKVKVGDKVLDSSVKSKLKQMKQLLTK